MECDFVLPKGAEVRSLFDYKATVWMKTSLRMYVLAKTDMVWAPGGGVSDMLE